MLSASIDDSGRKKITDALGLAGSNFRTHIYNHKFSGATDSISGNELAAFANNALQFIEHSIRANKRADNLYHAYNLLSFENNGIKISHLSEMLEGQVAVLSSFLLTPQESLQVLDALRHSSLYRADQNSYILYPNKALPKFAERNTIPASLVEGSALLTALLRNNNRLVVDQDVRGAYHFNGNFKNAKDLNAALDNLANDYKPLVEKERQQVLQVFEEVFNHKEFTGRSGTFFAFEGLGSIYWHMVSKLSLAVQETCLRAIEQHADDDTVNRLVAHYYSVNDGIGVHKSPATYGAFPITPYSHTPMHKGAQQPGMTGQVKEDILARIGELGVKMKAGKLVFEPSLLHSSEFLQQETTATFIMADNSLKQIPLQPGSLAFTICQVPVIYKKATSGRIEVSYANGSQDSFYTNELNEAVSQKIVERTCEVDHLTVYIAENTLRQ
jgi:hypothetical protein